MSGTFNDHFAAVATQYADYRPSYPPELFAWLANQCAQHDLAWDCGAGSGQASLGLAKHFAHVLATDASAAQIAQARAHPRIDYRVTPAEASGLEASRVDLVAVAQALHWFDLDAFYLEAIRVLKPDGLIAVWSYGVFHLADDELNAIAQNLYAKILGPYWPPERQHVETGYHDLAFPFQRIAAPPFAMHMHWNLAQLLGYFRSWSATGRFIEARGYDPISALEVRLRASCGYADWQCRVTWPVNLRVGRRE